MEHIIDSFHRALLDWHMSQMSHFIYPKTRGAYLVHLKKKKRVDRLWDKVKNTIPQDHREGYLSLVEADWCIGIKKSYHLCKKGYIN